MHISEHMPTLFKVSQQEKTTIRRTTIRSKRAYLLSQFVEEINKERPCTYKTKQGKKKTAKPVTGRFIAVTLSHLSEFDLEYFLSECKDYRNRNGSFSKGFFGMLKPKQE